ncbi:IS66 family insertion sequence element accessory protein TnpB, partial [Levilactobacillus enshiensis]
MLIDSTRVRQVFIVCGKTDLRRGIDGLADIVQEQFELDP